jgi:hypothetical protein
MPSQSGSNAQFYNPGVSIGTWIDQQQNRDVVDVTPFMSGTDTSANRATAWRLSRKPNSLPQPFTKKTAGSIYRFNETE